MMRVICLLLVSVIAIKLNAQQYTKFNGYGFQADRLKADSISIHPSDTVRNKAARSIAVLNGVFYIADGTKWKVVGTDTTSLSNRIDARVKYTDTATMLSPYLRKADTTTLSNRINLKLNISDTATMLSPYSKLKSVGLSMPSAFNVANSPLTSNGTIAVTGAGTSAQYVRGDGQLANFPSNGGGGSSVNYYLNGSVNQGTIGGNTYYQLSKVPIIGTGTDFTRTNAQGNGYIASFITDAADPALLNIPGGNWNLEFYFSASSGGSTPSFYAEIYKVSSTNVFTLIASGSTNPEGITQGTVVDQYFTSVPVPQTTILATDRIAIRIFVTTSGRNITLHTEDNNLCEVLTTFSTGLNALNGLTNQVQYFATGTSGSDFNISSATNTHTFNLPTASGANRGALSSTDWTTFNNKLSLSDTFTISTRAWRQKGLDSLAAIELNVADTATMLNPYTRGSGTNGQVAYWNGTRSLTGNSNLFWDNTNARLGIGTTTPANTLDVNGTARVQGNATVALNQNGATELHVSNTINSAASQTLIRISSSTGSGLIGRYSASSTPYKTLLANNTFFYSAGVSDISFLNDYALGSIKFATGGVSTPQITLFNTGNLAINTTTDAGFRLDVNGTARVQSTLKVGAATTQNASAVLDVESTTQGFLPPRMTTAQRDLIATPAAGLVIYNTSTNKHQGYNGTTWNDFY